MVFASKGSTIEDDVMMFEREAAKASEASGAPIGRAAKRRYSILLVSDYFFPNLGGVEMHMFQLGQCLMELGHKVVIMTNTYSKERMGVRYVSNGMKVYHLPLLPFTS